MEKLIGEIFISKLTGKKIIISDSPSRGRCLHCVYHYHKLGGCYGIRRILRQKEAGHCSAASRSDHKNVYFKVVENLYEITKETTQLIYEIYELVDLVDSSQIESLDQYQSIELVKEEINHIRLLLEIEYLNNE